MNKATSLLAVLALGACTNVAAPDLGPQNARELPVFVLRENGASAEQVRGLLGGVGITARITNPDPSAPISYVDPQRFMVVPNKTVVRGTSKEGEGATVTPALDVEALKRVRPLAAQAAVGRALEAFRGAGMLPDTLSPLVSARARAEHSTFEVRDRRGGLVARANLDTHVLFDLRLEVGDGVPLVGPGAKVKVVFDPSGRATQLYYGLYGLEQVGTTAALPTASADEACARAFSRGGLGFTPRQVSAELVYHVPNAQGRLGRARLSPSYLCRAAVPSGDGTADARSVLIDATTGRPRLSAPLAPPRNTAPTLSARSIPRVDVGAEYIGTSQGLGGSQANTQGFTATMSARGVPVQFHWGDLSAYERDFKDPGKKGDDSSYVDDVDMTFYTGHASGDGFTFASSRDDGLLHYGDAAWGNRDLEWLVVAACGPLQETSSGLSYAQRWGPAFRGLHMMLAYANNSIDNTQEGKTLASGLLGSPVPWFGSAPKKVRQAWVEAATQTQPSGVTWALMGPFGSNYSHNYDDFFWGKGGTSGDITSPVWYWRVTGPS